MIQETKKMIKLSDLLSEDHKSKEETFHKGKSKSGLDWDCDKDYPKEDLAKLENTIDGEDLVEVYEGEDLDERQLRGYIKSIHKMAAELYNVLEDTDDPEEWVMEKAKQCDSMLHAIHGHVSYAKDKDRVSELERETRDQVRERGY